MATQGVRLSEDTIIDARKEAGVMSRTVSAQIEHWIRIGKAMESAPTYDDRLVKSALRGEVSPDELDPYERSVYDVEHEQRMRTASQAEVDYYKQLGRRQAAAGFSAEDLGT